jgi:hypothetical protein
MNGDVKTYIKKARIRSPNSSRPVTYACGNSLRGIPLPLRNPKCLQEPTKSATYYEEINIIAIIYMQPRCKIQRTLRNQINVIQGTEWTLLPYSYNTVKTVTELFKQTNLLV